jgi:hypothetical protein
MKRAKGRTSAGRSHQAYGRRLSGGGRKARRNARGVSLMTFREMAYELKREGAGTAAGRVGGVCESRGGPC